MFAPAWAPGFFIPCWGPWPQCLVSPRVLVTTKSTSTQKPGALSACLRLMDASIWSATLAEFRDQVGGAEPVPAGVAISAVAASLALALLSKVLRITGGRKDFVGD